MKGLLIAILCLLVILVGLNIYDLLNPVKYSLHESLLPTLPGDTGYELRPYR